MKKQSTSKDAVPFCFAMALLLLSPVIVCIFAKEYLTAFYFGIGCLFFLSCGLTELKEE